MASWVAALQVSTRLAWLSGGRAVNRGEPAAVLGKDGAEADVGFAYRLGTARARHRQCREEQQPDEAGFISQGLVFWKNRRHRLDLKKPHGSSDILGPMAGLADTHDARCAGRQGLDWRVSGRTSLEPDCPTGVCRSISARSCSKLSMAPCVITLPNTSCGRRPSRIKRLFAS